MTKITSLQVLFNMVDNENKMAFSYLVRRESLHKLEIWTGGVVHCHIGPGPKVSYPHLMTKDA